MWVVVSMVQSFLLSKSKSIKFEYLYIRQLLTGIKSRISNSYSTRFGHIYLIVRLYLRKVAIGISSGIQLLKSLKGIFDGL
jgi:hypothetical protein